MDDITRRSFLDRAGKSALGGLAAAGALEGLAPKDASAQQGAKPQNWLTLTDEPALEPALPIIDPHHHLWDRPGDRYLLEELVADARAHNVRQTVFIECTSMYRADGPEEFKVVGETEFVQGIAAMSASGRYGDDAGGGGHRRHGRPPAGRPGRTGARGANRGEPAAFSRHPSSRGVGGSLRGSQPTRRSPATCAPGFRLPARLRPSAQVRLVVRGLGLSHAHRRPRRISRGRSRIRRLSSTISAGRSAWGHTQDVATRCSPHGSRRRRPCEVPQCGREGGRHPDGGQWLRLARTPAAANVGRTAGGQREVVPLHDRAVWSRGGACSRATSRSTGCRARTPSSGTSSRS